MSEAPTFPAKVVTVKDYTDGGYEKVIINRGSAHGIREGMLLLVYALGEEILDPETGENLGRLEIIRGKGYATHVQEKMTTITSKSRKEYSYIRPNSFQAMAAGLRGEELRREVGEIVPFNEVREGDLVKPL